MARQKIERFHCTELGNAKRLVARHGADLRYVAGQGWLAFDGVCWRRDAAGEATRRAKSIAREVLVEASRCDDDHRRGELRAWSAKCEKAAVIAATVTLAATEPEVAIDASAFNLDGWLLNVENGTIDLRTGELREHRREDLITKLAPVAFDASATCPTWEAFLGRIFAGNAALTSYVQRVAGYMLTGSTREHCLFFLFGDGSNGKSTFANTLARLMGDFAVAAPRGLLISKRYEAHPTELVTLHGERMALCAEIDGGQSFDESKLKALCSDEAISCHRMHEDYWTYVPSHKLVISGNRKPSVRGTDLGMWRRLRVIPFGITIPPEERDRELLDKLGSELPGILTWAMQGCLEWQRIGLGDPPEVVEATETYREEQDVVAGFVDEHLDLVPDGRISRQDIQRHYLRWIENNNIEERLPAVELYARLRAKGLVEVKVRGVLGFAGARLKSHVALDSFADSNVRPLSRGHR